jgi:molecular chaperone DnaK (HSP70)
MVSMIGWAIDIGNSHTRVARWDAEAATPRLLELPAICRLPGGTEPLAAPRLIPSATEIIDPPNWAARVGSWPLMRRHFFLGQRAVIGRPAMERNLGYMRTSFAPAFKPFLDRESLRLIARTSGRCYTARDVARLFFRELLAAVKRQTGVRIRDLVLTTPVEAFETYRAELLRIGRGLGVRRIRFIDEPVAASLGYGLSLGRERLVLVVDFGAGTLDLALVALSARRAEEGRAEVLAKDGRAVGGNLVDAWLLADLARALGYPLDEPSPTETEETVFWRRLMLAEARRVKEALFFKPWTIFHFTPPAYLRHQAVPASQEPPWLEITRDRLVHVLEQHDLYGLLEQSLETVLAQARRADIGEDDIEDVLMIGGSTLLPGVYPLFEQRFGRDRVRAWQPFEAVVFGACALAAESFSHSDFIVHDYAFVTYDPKTHDKQYTVIVPRGTHFPTRGDFWKGRLVPTCALGEPETMFKLVVCELGRAGQDDHHFIWDERGNLHHVGGQGGRQEPVVVPLNATSPTLGSLDPPHSPRDRKPRLEVSFGVNAERWLCATVYDLKTQRTLLDGARVVRLL